MLAGLRQKVSEVVLRTKCLKAFGDKEHEKGSLITQSFHTNYPIGVIIGSMAQHSKAVERGDLPEKLGQFGTVG